ncbi:MAG: ABC transporter ATP-binding protein [Balneolaceae bacterium]|nr:ABC transporter ATP-binding protein [Balneolaceae bacterium]MBO6547266.1 ABC transporter ATP-binding protein [Balneolaceae bacterium]MBO6647787.1 ABC transporter ATP-binding protein [Balneolaceae bacterium]
MNSLSIKNFSKQYPNGVKALSNISLEISDGMFGLLGPNGAGKSTLMRTIATLQRPDSGSLFFNGINIHSEHTKLRRLLGYLPQEFGVYPNESAERLLNYFGILKGISSVKERRSKIQEVLELTNLFDVRKNAVSDYSGGMRQRFGIAQLLLNDPKLIIVDEPTAGLDPAERRRFLNLLREISQDTVVIFSTHLVEDVTELCQNLAMINKGMVLMEGTPTNIVQNIETNIWTCDIATDKLSEYKTKYSVLSSSFTPQQKLRVRVFSRSQPSPEFTLSTASLEDAYFLILQITEAEHA